MRFVLRLVGTMLGIWVSTLLVPEIHIAQGTTLVNSLLLLAAIALILTLVNSIVRPVVKFFAWPLYLITFGLFALVTNALVFMAAGWASSSLGVPFEVGSMGTALLGGTITAVISALTVALLGEDKGKKKH
ncbi:phage holin family protein [Schaalia sp. 19OD2882]|uniref:phage holin family protein n=1 Tax=Schaalia sp. 19OD2882 TaxID=2794089 RepID=UPI001C1ED83A|nr:phage holin family protein [Schaalia sp. 19OD2882]QWW19703.1 phage holin family protein [Schaalia sp. 19OD2882]